MGRGLDWMTHRGPCQPLLFCDSVTRDEPGAGVGGVRRRPGTRQSRRSPRPGAELLAHRGAWVPRLQQPSPCSSANYEAIRGGELPAGPELRGPETETAGRAACLAAASRPGAGGGRDGGPEPGGERGSSPGGALRPGCRVSLARGAGGCCRSLGRELLPWEGFSRVGKRARIAEEPSVWKLRAGGGG